VGRDDDGGTEAARAFLSASSTIVLRVHDLLSAA
jgi:hypothetical protein